MSLHICLPFFDDTDAEALKGSKGEELTVKVN